MIIDNTAQLSKIMVFKPNTYYKFVILLREKDGSTVLRSYNKKEIIVKQWLIDSQEKLDEMLPDMITMTNLTKGRLYMTTDRKSVAKTLFQMQDKINIYIKQMFNGDRTEISVKQLNKLLASASSEAESTDGEKRWLYDVDTDNMSVVEYLKSRIGSDSYLATFKTKNGYHVIAQRDFYGQEIIGPQYNDYAFSNGLQNVFLTKENKPVVECKDNALVLVYMNCEVPKK